VKPGHDGDYELVLTPPARRAVTDQLPEAVASAVIDFLTSSLINSTRCPGLLTSLENEADHADEELDQIQR